MNDTTENNPGMMEVPITKFADIPDFAILDKPAKIQEFLDMLVVHAQKIILDNSLMNLPPAVFFILEDGGTYILNLNDDLLSDPNGKDMVNELVKGLIVNKKDPEVHAVIMVSEAWIVEIPNTPDVPKDLVVSEHPDKQEIIMINCQTKEDTKIIKIPIVRMEDSIILGIPVKLPIEKSNTSGRFSFFE